MPIYEGTITFRFRAPSAQVAELYVDGLCTAMRYNKPEIAEKSVRWNIAEVSDDLSTTERELNSIEDPTLHSQLHEEFEQKQLPPPSDPED